MKTKWLLNFLFFTLLSSTISCGTGSNEEDKSGAEDTYGLEKTNGLSYFCDYTEVDGYRTYKDSFKELKYIGSNKFEIDGIQYSITKAEKDFGVGNRTYILTLDKGKIIEGETFPININVNNIDGTVAYDLWYRVYGVLFLSSFEVN